MDKKRMKAHQLLNNFILSDRDNSAREAFNELVLYMLENFEGPSSNLDIRKQQKKDCLKILNADPKLTGPQLLSIIRIDPPVMDDATWSVAVMRLIVGVIRSPHASLTGTLCMKWALRYSHILL